MARAEYEYNLAESMIILEYELSSNAQSAPRLFLIGTIVAITNTA